MIVLDTNVISALMRRGRRQRLEDAFTTSLSEDFDLRIAVFEPPAVREAARLAAMARKVGRPVEIRDMQIAGIVTARRATLVTRNVRHFEHLDVDLVNPWT